MTTEQQQKKILFAGLAILVCAAIFLYSASLFDRNVAEISDMQPPISFQERLDSLKNEKLVEEVEEVEPVTVAADWKTYKNAKYGIEFRYPKEWPAPVLTETKSPSKKDESYWRLGIGEQKPSCEGVLCHELTIVGYRGNNHQSFLEKLKNDELTTIESESRLNGADTVVFASGGMCGYRNAYIFGKQTSLLFSAHCGEDDPGLGTMFDAILSTLKLTK